MTSLDEQRRNLIWRRNALEELSRDASLQANRHGEIGNSSGATLQRTSWFVLTPATCPGYKRLPMCSPGRDRLSSRCERDLCGPTPAEPIGHAQALRRIAIGLKQAWQLVALDALVEPFDEGLKRGVAGVRPQSQLEHVNTTVAGLAATDEILTDVHPVRQFHLTEPSLRPEGVELIKEQLVLLTVKRVSHPVAVAHAADQDQREDKLWENAIIQIPALN